MSAASLRAARAGAVPLRPGSRPGSRGEEGQSSIEFAVVLPLFLLLFLGMLELGNAWIASSAAAAAAQEGAEWARRQSPESPDTFNKANEIAEAYAGRFLWNGSGILVAATTKETVGSSELLTVTVDLRYNLITGNFLKTFRFGAFHTGNLHIKRSASVLMHSN